MHQYYRNQLRWMVHRPGIKQGLCGALVIPLHQHSLHSGDWQAWDADIVA